MTEVVVGWLISSCLAVSKNIYPHQNMKFLVIFALVAVAVAEDAYKPSYSAPAYPAPGYSKSYDYAPQPYNFAYDVKDEPSYNDFGHQETADGKVTSGSYKVVLPDGRTQVVTYKDDGYGLVASVKTEGAIKSYDYKPAYNAPAYPSPSDYPAKY
uniref:Cuticle protein n=1 Tax=Daphnia magna TaxID=35525 RepID=A0A0P4Z0R4_9CRUS